VTKTQWDDALATGQCMVHSLLTEGFTPCILIGFSQPNEKDPVKSIRLATLSKPSVMRLLSETLYKLALCPEDSFRKEEKP